MASTKKTLVPPAKPKHRVINNLKRMTKVMPYFLAGDPDIIANYMAEGRIAELIDMEDVYAVGVGPLKAMNYINYEGSNGETLDQVANKLMYCFYAVHKMLNPESDDNPKPELVTDEEHNTISTPYGVIYGSMEKNALLLLAFLMSQYGRIVGVLPNGNFEYEPVTEDDLLSMLDPTAIFAMDEDKPLFLDILELTHLFDPTQAESKLKSDGAVTDDELKNSASQNAEGSSTKRPSRRKSTSVE